MRIFNWIHSLHGHFSTTGARILGARGMPCALHLWGPCYSEILSWYHSVIMASLPGVKRGGTRVLHNLGDGNVIITRHVVQHCTPLINFKVNSFSTSCLFVTRMLGHTACKASSLCVNANEIFFYMLTDCTCMLSCCLTCKQLSIIITDGLGLYNLSVGKSIWDIQMKLFFAL